MRQQHRNSLLLCTWGVWKQAACGWFSGVDGCWTGPALCAATAEEDTSGALFTTGVTKLKERTTLISKKFPWRNKCFKLKITKVTAIPVSSWVSVAVRCLTYCLWVRSWWNLEKWSGNRVQHTRSSTGIRGCYAFILWRKQLIRFFNYNRSLIYWWIDLIGKEQQQSILWHQKIEAN